MLMYDLATTSISSSNRPKEGKRGFLYNILHCTHYVKRRYSTWLQVWCTQRGSAAFVFRQTTIHEAIKGWLLHVLLLLLFHFFLN